MTKRKTLPRHVAERCWRSPCVVCGFVGASEADHITPLARGGTNDPSNIQPLCTVCNQRKGCRLSNQQLADRVMQVGVMHYAKAICRAMRPVSFDNPDAYSLKHDSPQEWMRAEQMFAAFAVRYHAARGGR
jgi:hypothetical protein